MLKCINFLQVKVQDSLPDVGQPVLPCLGVELRDDFQLSVLHSLTGNEIITSEYFINVFRVQMTLFDYSTLHYVYIMGPDMVT